uniref:Uncharacterized protein n=1 Tax=Trypanosoma congolense (strain IL3000) TaxID=1068625 RepID=G0UJ85_TRYCI|nr:conserved hypothetical protein [Trypanosoma congolense IL3000]
MKRMPFREIACLCDRLQSCKGSDIHIRNVVSDSIRTRVLDSSTLPLLIQRLVLDGGWEVALQVAQSSHLDKRGIQLDHNIWPIIERSSPCDDSRRAVRKALVHLFAAVSAPPRK